MGRFRAGLTFSVTCSSCHYLHTVLPFIASPSGTLPSRIVTTPEELPSFHELGQAPLLAPSHPPLISPVAYRLALPPFGRGRRADEVGLSPVNVVSRFVQAMPPVTLMARGS